MISKNLWIPAIRGLRHFKGMCKAFKTQHVTYLSVFNVILESEPSPALVADPVLDAVLRARSGRDVTCGQVCLSPAPAARFQHSREGPGWRGFRPEDPAG